MGQTVAIMSTNRPEVTPPLSTNPTPGVWTVDRPGRPNPFGVQWRERVWSPSRKAEVEEKRTEFFSSASDRDKRRDDLFANKRAGRANDLSREEAHEWRAFQAAAGGVPWRTILAGFHAWQHHTGAKNSGITVETYRARYLAECVKRTERTPPEMSADNFRHRKKALQDFAGSFGHLLLEQVKADAVATWLEGLGHASPFTWNSQRKHLNAFFNDAVHAGVIAVNPVANLKRRRAVLDNRKRILSPRQTAQLFACALTQERFQPILARLALEAFVGIRFSSAQRLEGDQINLGDRGVLLPAGRLKTGLESGVGHYIEGAPEQLWEWIALSPTSGWAVTERQYLALKSSLFIAANVPHPPNCFRKSFCTYDLNAHRNPGRTAYLLGHTNQKQLWQTYKGNATQGDSVLYQAITPQTCALIARGGWPRGLRRPRKAPALPGGSVSGDSPAHTGGASD
jgi:integrase